jgi:hypothetical protein
VCACARVCVCARVPAFVRRHRTHQVRLQLVMGRELRRCMGDDDAAREMIKQIRPGCVIGVSVRRALLRRRRS